MSGVNKVILIGRLGQDPDIRYTQGGTAVCNLSIATSQKFKSSTGVDEEKTEWHKVIVWGKMGENAHKFLKKGHQVYFEGRLETRSWDDKTTGVKRYTTEIVANAMNFLHHNESASNREPTGPAWEPPDPQYSHDIQIYNPPLPVVSNPQIYDQDVPF